MTTLFWFEQKPSHFLILSPRGDDVGVITTIRVGSLFQAFRQWGAVRSKKECEKIKAREGER